MADRADVGNPSAPGPPPASRPHEAGSAELYARDADPALPSTTGMSMRSYYQSQRGLPGGGFAPVRFPPGGAAIPSGERRRIMSLCGLLRERGGSWQVVVRGEVSTDRRDRAGGEALALRRAEAIRRLFLPQAPQVTVFVDVGDPGRSNARSHRATVEVRYDPAHIVLVHEAGHMFGLGDEYTNPDDPNRTDVSHSDLARRVHAGAGVAHQRREAGEEQGRLGPVSRGVETSNLMASGLEMFARNYITFVEAIAQLTGSSVDEWQIDNIR